MNLRALSSNKVKIMIVDDSALMRNALSRIIESDPFFEVIERAENGQQALDKLKRLPQERQPDIIMTDIEMPVMDGLTFLRHARLKTRAKVVVLSSQVDKVEVFKKAMRLGSAAIIKKPSGAVSFDLETASRSEILNTLKSLSPNSDYLESSLQ